MAPGVFILLILPLLSFFRYKDRNRQGMLHKIINEIDFLFFHGSSLIIADTHLFNLYIGIQKLKIDWIIKTPIPPSPRGLLFVHIFI